MKIAHVRLNPFWVPTVYDWAHVGLLEDKTYTIPMGRKDEHGYYPFEIWMNVAEGPLMYRKWWRNWFRAFVTEGEPQVANEIVALKEAVPESQSSYGRNALLLLIDLHNGRRPPRQVPNQNFNGSYMTTTQQLVNQLYLAQVGRYPVGALVVYPGYRAQFSPEGSLARYNLWYNPEAGIEIFQQEPTDIEMQMMAAAIGCRTMMWH